MSDLTGGDWATWQDFLWALPTHLGRLWYLAWGAVAGVAGVLIFVVAVMPSSLSLALLGRIVFCVGCGLIPLAALNSGWQPWIPAFFAASALIHALALTIDRCDDGQPITVLGALMGRARTAIGRLGVRSLRGRDR